MWDWRGGNLSTGLNPCFSGCNLKLAAEFNLYVPGMGLNPCFSGCNLKLLTRLNPKPLLLLRLNPCFSGCNLKMYLSVV